MSSKTLYFCDRCREPLEQSIDQNTFYTGGMFLGKDHQSNAVDLCMGCSNLVGIVVERVLRGETPDKWTK